MSKWRQQAFERFPELRALLQKVKNPYAYWIELQFAFARAYRMGNIDLFKRILDYVDWSLEQPKGKTAADDLGTCVYCCFIEHIPEISPSATAGKSELPRDVHKQKSSIYNDPNVRRLYRALVNDEAKIRDK
jgi:hypothetical protein